MDELFQKLTEGDNASDFSQINRWAEATICFYIERQTGSLTGVECLSCSEFFIEKKNCLHTKKSNAP